MAADGGEGNVQTRWLDVARYTVASVVAVLIFAVIINAIKVVLRPATLSLSVAGGSVFVRRIPPPPKEVLVFDFNLQAQNPSGRARMFYVNITVYLFDNNTAPSSLAPENDSMVFFHKKDIVVRQQVTVTSSLHVSVTKASMDSDDFYMLYNKNATISDVTMRLDGFLTTEVTVNNTQPATYYCWPLLVGGNPDDEAFKNPDDVRCVVKG